MIFSPDVGPKKDQRNMKMSLKIALTLTSITVSQRPRSLTAAVLSQVNVA